MAYNILHPFTFLYDGNIAKFEALFYSRVSLQIAKYLLSLNSREPI